MWARRAGLAAQGFALAGTTVGIFTIAIGVGPRTFADVLYHIIIVCVLIYGLLLAARTRAALLEHRMDNELVAHASTTVEAPVPAVWDALVNPAVIKEYMFGANVSSELEGR